MAWFKINGQKLTAIADAIRAPLGTTTPMNLDAMATAIPEIYDMGVENGDLQGYERGHVEGYEAGNKDGYQTGYTAGHRDGHFEGYDTGKAEGIEQGKQAEYDAFWDAYQANGNTTNYASAFSDGHKRWKLGKSYRPKYPMKPTNAQQMYYGTGLQYEAFVTYPVDFSQCTNFYQCFAYSLIDRLPVIDMSKATSTISMFLSCNYLHTIDKIISSEDTVFDTYMFGASKLANITFEGVIGKSIAFVFSPLLTNASVQSIIDHLKDLTNQTPQTLTLRAEVKANLTEEQLATITGKNWSVA